MVILIKSFCEPSCLVDEDVVILEQTIVIRIETFPHRIKVISQKNFVLF